MLLQADVRMGMYLTACAISTPNAELEIVTLRTRAYMAPLLPYDSWCEVDNHRSGCGEPYRKYTYAEMVREKQCPGPARWGCGTS